MKKLSLLLALLLLVSAFAVACTPAVNNPEDSSTEPAEEQTEPTEDTTESTEETTTTVVDGAGDFGCAFVLAQVSDKQQFTVQCDSTVALKKLEITVNHGDQVVATKVVEGDALSEDVVIDAFYGKHTVTLKATAEDDSTCGITTTMALSADEYVIAPISGSMPQLYFTLYMDEITKNHEIPAFVWLARPGSWNWDNLPDNVYPMPTVDVSEVLKHNNYDLMIQTTDAYIEELFSIDPTSKFNLYINDINAYLYMKLLPGNGIPEENYNVALLSDGGASYTSFNKAFNSTDPNFDADAKYDQMATKLATLYTEVREAKDYNWTQTFTVDTTTFQQYSYVAAREMDNVEWWLLRPRKDPLLSPDEEFINRVTSNAEGGDRAPGIIVERNFSSPLTTMTDEQKASLKALYNFNDEMFQKADEENKKAMVILGSWVGKSEPDFEDYVNLVKAYYGDEDYVYYYKGHPNTPTDMYPSKQEQLDQLGLIDVESSINAELILFFYPGIYMCGYDSSTFMSVERDEMACALFNLSKADAEPRDYDQKLDFFVTKIDTASSAYAELCTEAEHTYYLMEYNDTTEQDFGIYDATTKTFAYYKVTDGVFTPVTK